MFVKTNPVNDSAWIVYGPATPLHPPERISAIVGDAVHNMRTALDSLVCGLISISLETSTLLLAHVEYSRLAPSWES